MRDFTIGFVINALFFVGAVEIGKGFAVFYMYEQCIKSNEVQMSPMMTRNYKFKCEAEVVE